MSEKSGETAAQVNARQEQERRLRPYPRQVGEGEVVSETDVERYRRHLGESGLPGIEYLLKIVALVERVTKGIRSLPDGEVVLLHVTVRVHWLDYAAAMRERFPWVQHQSDFQICCTGNLAVRGVKVVPAYDVERRLP